MGFWKILEKLFKRKTDEVEPYVEKDTKCDKCEYLQERIAEGKVIDCRNFEDTRSHYIKGLGSCIKCDCVEM